MVFRAERHDQADDAGGRSGRQRPPSPRSRSCRWARGCLHRRGAGWDLPGDGATGARAGKIVTPPRRAVSVLSRTAARSVNHEVKVALAHIIELLSHYAELHRALQMPERDTHIDVAAYLENLCLSISRSKLDGMKIALVLTASPLWLPSERCWRLGMMVYELVTNSARHAFCNGKGEIHVELSRAS